MSNQLPYFRLFSSCLPVSGQQQSYLYDLERKDSYEIPGLLVEVLEKTYDFSIADLKAHFDHQYDEGIDAYLLEFEKMELGFFTDEPAAFPKLKMRWEDPLEIQTAIVEVGKPDSYDVPNVIEQLNQLGCAALQLRLLEPLSLDTLKTYLAPTLSSRLRSIELYAADAGYQEEELKEFLKDHVRINLFVLHSSEAQKVLELEEGGLRIAYQKGRVKAAMKDFVTPNHFVMDVKYFSEAHQYNASLNRKVSIDAKGLIKHYPSFQQSFGHVTKDAIGEVVKSDAFQEKWLVANDKIVKCKDCPYRYICFFNSDIKRSGEEWVKLEDCGYDPATGEWQNQ